MKELTDVQIVFLCILETFMHDREYHFPENFTQLEELGKMAAVHNMTAAVYEQILREPILQSEKYQGFAQFLKRKTIHDVILQTQKTEGFCRIYKQLNEAGVKPLVVKGIICRNLYTKSDYRISGDEDILVRKEEFEICDRILLQEGFQRDTLNMDQLPYEIPYLQPQTGVYIELHFSLFPEESGAYGHLNKEFQHVFEKSICENIQGTDIWTLSPTDHMFYLICHSFKHFLHSGFGLRQVCDMVKMAEYYGAEINWESIDKKLKRLHMETYWNGLVEIGKKYLGFSYEAAHYPGKMQMYEAEYKELLFDLLESGIYGDSSLERKHSSNMTLAAVKSGKKNMSASLSESLFPKLDYMQGGYPWLQKFPWLLPIAWVARIVKYLRFLGKSENQENSVEIGMNRVELLRKYNIIE